MDKTEKHSICRDVAEEEQKMVDNYIKAISQPMGVSVFQKCKYELPCGWCEKFDRACQNHY